MAKRLPTTKHYEESSESEAETDFIRFKTFTSNVKFSSTTKEGYLMKQTWTFQRWKRRYFRLKGHKLFYAKTPDSNNFDEIDLSNLCCAECSTKNINHSFQIITPTRSLVLGAETRCEMEDWCQALKMAASTRDFFDPAPPDQHDFLSGHHHWYATSHARPTYCNVCRDTLSGVTSHGLSCEVCKFKVHKRCAAKAIANCKWTTLASIGKEIIEDSDGNLIMPHQWHEGNLPVSAKCSHCDKTCGSVLRLQDWRCLWCKITVHTACRPNIDVRCPLGPVKVSVIPPTCLHSIGIDDSWDVVKPQGSFSPLLVFVNSKSGDNQGVKFLRRFKQLLNPAQVFDLISTGPEMGLRLFKHFDPFRILICSGDGSIGWVLAEIDRLNMHKQCQIAVLPLGTGNDLARVLGWGSSCDDDAHLPQLLDRYEKASTKMLDRWSIMVYERGISFPARRGMSISRSPDAILSQFEDNAMWHLQSIIETEDFQSVIASVRLLCETITDFLGRITETHRDDEQLLIKCDILRQKMGMLVDSLKDEEMGVFAGDDLLKTMEEIAIRSSASDKRERTPENEPRKRRFSFGKSEKDKINSKERTSRLMKRSEKEAVHCRANSLKRNILIVIEHVDAKYKSEGNFRKMSLKTRFIPTSSSETSPCTSPFPMPPTINLANTRLTCISPLPDVRRESVDESFLNTLSIPVPRQFADDGSRRNSGVPENIMEVEEENYSDNSSGSKNSNLLTVKHATDTLHFKYDLKTINRIEENMNTEFTYKLNLDQREEDDDYNLDAFCPIEVYERRSLLRNLQQKQLHQQQELQKECESSRELLSSTSHCVRARNNVENTTVSNSLQIPIISLPTMMEKLPPPMTQNVYMSENMTIIDTDVVQQQDRSSSDEIIGETSDIISAISNEECSVASEILDQRASEVTVGEMIQDLNDDRIGHIDSPETSETTTDALHGESLFDDISSVLGHDFFGALGDSTFTDDTTLCKEEGSNLQRSRNKSLKNKKSVDSCATQYGFENRIFDIPDMEKDKPPVRYCSLARFEEGSDISRKSFRHSQRSAMTKSASITKQLSNSTTRNYTTSSNNTSDDQETHNPNSSDTTTTTTTTTIAEKPMELNTIKIQIQGSISDLSVEYEIPKTTSDCQFIDYKSAILTDASDNEDKDDYYSDKRKPNVSVFVEPPSPSPCDRLRALRGSEYYRRHSSHLPSSLGAPREMENMRRHSNHNPNLINIDPEHAKYLNSSPAASRRISCGTLFKSGERLTFGSARNIFSSRKSISKNHAIENEERKREETKAKTLPIINPLVRLPSWPNVQSGAGFISKCLLANADTLCSLACPLMDPDETLLEGFYERSVMNNYFGIGIDAKISLDFHLKREEHPEKCRSRAKNYMWYGVLGSKQWLQKTYKNLEQRVQLECDGQRIPLPSLQGIVILNIPSFMGGTNFWGGRKEDDIFLAPSFDDRILEVVAVFGSVQMAACRLINVQHHRIAQCQSVQINILGDEGVPIQVDGEAWLQPPGMIRIIHKNRVQVLSRNRSLEVSLKSWHEKQRQHSISIAREQTSLTSEYSTALGDSLFTERETYLLLNFIENVSTLIKCVKFLIISHPSLQPDLYAIATKTADSLEAIHPGGKIIDGPNLRQKLTELVASTRQLYESACELLRERGHSLIMREDLETKLSIALANIEMELRKCTMQRSEDGTMKIYLNVLAPNNDDASDQRKKPKPFWLRFRNRDQLPGNSRAAGSNSGRSSSREAVSNWGVNEVIVWLEAQQLSEYIDSFIKNDIRGKELLTLARRDLKDLGVTKVGHVKRILQAIKDLQTN